MHSPCESLLPLIFPVSVSPDSRVLSIADGRELLSEQWVHFCVDGHQLAQSFSSSQSHCTARVLQGFKEGGLQLRKEGLQSNAHLGEMWSAEVRGRMVTLHSQMTKI